MPVAEPEEGAARDVDAEALAAIRGEASTPAGVARALAQLASGAGAEVVEVTGADGSVWTMVRDGDTWSHCDPARATGFDDASWLMLDDVQMAQAAPDAAP